MSSESRKSFTKEELLTYYKRIDLDKSKYEYGISAWSDEEQLDYLRELLICHLTTVPFENLSLHYVQNRQVSIHPDALYKKIVQSGRNRGGYCMEQNALFATVLHTLGFRIYSVGARVSAGGPTYTGWSHMCNLVVIGGVKYMVDVGFGPNAPTRPLPLDKENAKVWPNIGSASQRLIYKKLPQHTDPGQRVWVYQFRQDDNADWSDWYSFVDVEFFPEDYALMNYYTSSSPKTWFTQKVICYKRMRGQTEQGSVDLIGDILLYDKTVKIRLVGQPEEREDFTTEDERLKALTKYFGINFDADEIQGIEGTGSAIKTRGF